MFRFRKLLFILILSIVAQGLLAQTIYFNSSGSIYSFDVANCTAVQIATGSVFNDMAIGPNGLIYGLFAQSIFVIDPMAGTSTLLVDIPSAISPSLEYGADGFLYMAGLGGVFQVNTTTGAWQNMGPYPGNWNCLGDVVYLNGIYYGTFDTENGSQLVNLNVTNPAASTFLGSLPAGNLVAGASVGDANCPKIYWFNTVGFNDPSEVWEYDVNLMTWTQICPGFSFSVFGADTPNDYTFPIPCGCTTEAGNVTVQNINLCGTSASVEVLFSGGQVLDADDVLRYILFENLSGPEGSILLQSTSPVFGFDANTMTLGQTYYLGTIAGNNLNGLVDLDDPCLDLSDNFAQVTWRALPTVNFSALPELCAGGCQNLEVNSTGTPPFILTYETSAGTTQSQAFTTNSGVLQVCPPAGFLGNFIVSAVSFSDANCVCD